MYPDLGKAGTEYAKSVNPQTSQPAAHPDPGLLFDSTLPFPRFRVIVSYCQLYWLENKLNLIPIKSVVCCSTSQQSSSMVPSLFIPPTPQSLPFQVLISFLFQIYLKQTKSIRISMIHPRTST